MKIPHAMRFVALENFLRAQNSGGTWVSRAAIGKPKLVSMVYGLFSQKFSYCPAAALIPGFSLHSSSALPSPFPIAKFPRASCSKGRSLTRIFFC